MTANDLKSYVQQVQALLANPQQLALLKAGCLASSKEFTVENMARHFTQGLLQCLAAEPLRGKA